MDRLINELLKEDIEFLKIFIREAIKKDRDLIGDIQADYIDWEKYDNNDYPEYKPDYPDWLLATKQLLLT